MIKVKYIADGIPNYGYLLFISLSLITFLTSLFLNIDENTLNTLSLIFLYSALGFIIKNSFFFHRSKYYKFFVLNVSIIIIGALFMILHIDYSREFLSISILSMIFIYTLYLSNKKHKSIIDYVKWSYITSLIALKVIRLNHYSYFDEFWIINFISTVLVVILIYIKHKPIPNWLNQ